MLRSINRVTGNYAQPASTVPDDKTSTVLSSLAEPAADSAGIVRRASRRPKMFALTAAAMLLPLLAIGIVSAYHVVPSIVIEFAATCAVYLLYLIAVLYVRGQPEFFRASKAEQPTEAGVVDRWLGLDIGDLGRVRPGSVEASMHLELGTLSATHLAQGGEDADDHLRPDENDMRAFHDRGSLADAFARVRASHGVSKASDSEREHLPCKAAAARK